MMGIKLFYKYFMKYENTYNQLIHTRLSLQPHRRNQRKKGKYFEQHHIVPRCLNGDDTDANLILVTGREHFIAHKLLWKIHGGVLFYAVWRMAHPQTTSGVGASITSRQFEVLRSQQQKNNRKCGEEHWNYGRHHSDEAKQKMRKAKLGKPSPRKGCQLSEETKEKLRQANIGKKASWETRQKRSETMKQSSHPSKTAQPFEQMKHKNSLKHKAKWVEADNIYHVWINNNKPGYVRLSTLTGVPYLSSMIAWFKQYGVPSDNIQWIEWKKRVQQEVQVWKEHQGSVP